MMGQSWIKYCNTHKENFNYREEEENRKIKTLLALPDWVQVLTVQRRILKALFSKNSEIQFLYKFTKYHCNVLSLTCKTTMSAHLFHGDSSEAMLHNMSNSSGAVTGFNVYNHLQSRDVAVELRVPMCCSKCEDKVREALIEMSGVDEVQTDQYNQKVTVVGMVEPEDVLKQVKRIKKRSELWTHEYSYSNIWSSRNQALTSPHTSSSIPIYGAPYIESTFDQVSYSQSAYGPSYIETTYDHATPSYNQVYDSY